MFNLAILIIPKHGIPKPEVNNMQAIRQYIGLDVHKKFVFGVIMDKEGTVHFSQKFKTEPQDIDMFLLNVKKD